MESQMVMRVMRQRTLLGNKWQMIRAKVQDKEELGDMERRGTAAELALRLAQQRRESGREGQEKGADEKHHRAKGDHKKSKSVRIKTCRARAASSRIIKESLQNRFDK